MKQEIKTDLMKEIENLHKIFEEKITNQIENNFKNLEDKTKNIISLSKTNNDKILEQSSQNNNEMETINKLQEDMNSHEENFEKIQNNFVKLNSNMTQLQENQKIFNDIIVNLKDNYNKLNQKVDEHLKEIDSWQKNILSQINQNFQSLKDEYENRINQLEKELKYNESIKIDDSLQNLTRNKNQNLKKEEIKKIENPIVKSKENENNEVENNQIENEENENVENVENNNNNEVNENINSENYDFEENDIGFREHTHGYINNLIEDFAIINNNLGKEKINLNPENKIQIKSINNNIPKTNIKDKDDEKIQKNEVYIRSSITELVEYKDNEIFGNYLKKYMTPMKNFESEIEFNINEGQNDKNDDDNNDNENNEMDSNMYRVEENYDDDIDEIN